MLALAPFRMAVVTNSGEVSLLALGLEIEL